MAKSKAEKWDFSSNFEKMFNFLSRRGNFSERKIRLFASAWIRHIGSACTNKRSLSSFLDTVDDYADGIISDRSLDCARYDFIEPPDFPEVHREILHTLHKDSEAIMWILEERIGIESACKTMDSFSAGNLLREIFSNPFRPIVLNSAWKTPTVIDLSENGYWESKETSGHLDSALLAILSDALEEAGCTNQEILDHLRSPGPHVRGCWALDLVLGKS